jgi:gas vesicle protein
MSNTEGSILSFIAGIAIGALIGVLVAPDKGSKTREKIAERSLQFKSELEEQVEISKEKIEKFADNIIRRNAAAVAAEEGNA